MSEKQLQVLYVEDDQEMARSLALALKRYNISLTAAGSYHRAWQLIQTRCFDLYLIDVFLKDGNGFDLCREIREYERTPVIFLTSAADEPEQIKGYEIIQSPGRFCFGMDAVLLSAFARVKKNEKALDLGTGTGILPILLEAKYPGLHYTGLEIQEESADMARRSVSYNGLEERIDIVTGDIKEAASIFGAASFGVITTNPPYMIGDHGLKNQNEALYIARHEALCTLDDILRECAKILKVKGRFYMVHRPFRLAEIMNVLTKYRLEPKKMQLVYPYIDREPNMVLIEALKGGNSRVTVEPPLIVYKEPGVYTENILKIYDMI